MAAKDISRKGSLHVTAIGTRSFFTISNFILKENLGSHGIHWLARPFLIG